jgi:GT2 family glycosyltransferase
MPFAQPSELIRHPRVSVVVCTRDRPASLDACLRSLGTLDAIPHEVIVVTGTVSEDTDAVVAAYREAVTVERVVDPNLARSRNVGIRRATGDLVAFLDDDAVARPSWLHELVPLFANPEVGVAGGPVLDGTGTELEALYALCDMTGTVVSLFDRHAHTGGYASPDSLTFPYAVGTNCVARRSLLAAIGGFDERYSLYFDDVDLARRAIDHGWVVASHDRGSVEHHRLENAVRSATGEQRAYSLVLASRLYFSLRHAVERVGLGVVVAQYAAAVDHLCRVAEERGRPASMRRETALIRREAESAVVQAFEWYARGPVLHSEAWFAGVTTDE